MFNRLFSQLTRRGAGAAPAAPPLRGAGDALLQAWLIRDVFPPYARAQLLGDALRAQVAGLIAEGAEAALLEPLLRRLQARGEALDAILCAEARLAGGAAAQAEALLAQLARLDDAIGARAAAMLAQRLIDRGDYAAAQPLAAHAQRLAPHSAGVQSALGQLRDFEGDHEAALAHFRRALALRPEDTALIGQLAVAQLARGDLRGGLTAWARADEVNRAYGERECPVWDGRPLAESRLLIICGYGFGDMLQFLRFAPLLRAREPGARICVLVPPSLERLARAMECFETVFASMPPRAQFDWQVTNTRLPLALGAGMEDLGGAPYLRIAPQDIAAAAAWLPPRRPGVKRVGLRWHGQAMPFDAKRSIPFGALRPLFEVPGIEWVALVEDPARLAGTGGLIDVSAHLRDFYATGALLQQLDLTLSADTSVTHVAGGLGLPLWLLARPDPEWRWGEAGEMTPWYPSIRVLRHAPGGFDWDELIARAARDLRAWAAT